MPRQIVLNAFDMNCLGHIQHGMWTHPRDRSVRYNTLEYWQTLARTAKRGLFDGIVTPEALEDFVDLVMPILQERDIYKRQYVAGPLWQKLFGHARLPDSHPAAAHRRRCHKPVGPPRSKSIP